MTLNQQLVPLGNNTPQRQGISTTKIIENYGNYIRVDTDFIFTTIKVNLDVNYRQFKDKFCFCSNEMQQCRIWRAKQN